MQMMQTNKILNTMHQSISLLHAPTAEQGQAPLWNEHSATSSHNYAILCNMTLLQFFLEPAGDGSPPGGGMDTGGGGGGMDMGGGWTGGGGVQVVCVPEHTLIAKTTAVHKTMTVWAQQKIQHWIHC